MKNEGEHSEVGPGYAKSATPRQAGGPPPLGFWTRTVVPSRILPSDFEFLLNSLRRDTNFEFHELTRKEGPRMIKPRTTRNDAEVFTPSTQRTRRRKEEAARTECVALPWHGTGGPGADFAVQVCHSRILSRFFEFGSVLSGCAWHTCKSGFGLGYTGLWHTCTLVKKRGRKMKRIWKNG